MVDVYRLLDPVVPTTRINAEGLGVWKFRDELVDVILNGGWDHPLVVGNIEAEDDSRSPLNRAYDLGEVLNFLRRVCVTRN